MANKYVDFVSDADFLECVKYVCEAYPKKSEHINLKKINSNTIDPIKQIFDIIMGDIDYNTWLKNETIRQLDKTVNNRIGEFHQKLLGKVKGWIDLEVGDTSKVDLKNTNETIFIELKNKHNTMNSDATDKCRDKLEKVIENKPNSRSYWAFIISKNGDSGEKV